MRKISTNELIPGMELATDVYNFNEQLIMVSGSFLDDKAITKLSFYAIPFVYIKSDSNQEELDTVSKIKEK